MKDKQGQETSSTSGGVQKTAKARAAEALVAKQDEVRRASELEEAELMRKKE